MVKTKVVAKKKAEPPKGNKKIIEQNLFEAKAQKKGEYRTKDQNFGGMGDDEPKGAKFTAFVPSNAAHPEWWGSMMDGETCRTLDTKKVHQAIDLSIKENKGLNIQGIPDELGGFSWYMTRILTNTESKKKGKRK